MKIRAYAKRMTTGLVIAVQLMFFPAVTIAQEATDTATTTPPAATTPGLQAPNGADAKTYTYNETTGLWENEHYTWDPVTKKTAPKSQPAYSYNPETNHWDTTDHTYNAATGRYEERPVSVPELPAGAKTTQEPDSNVENSSENSGAFDLFYNAGISNNINSVASTGNALVGMNTTGGSALSGNALSMANIINLLQSSWGVQGSDFATFNANINGDVFGDLHIDPNQISGSSSLALGSAPAANLDVNIAANSNIENNVDLTAKSGDATVTSNTTAGDATTGSANAVANIVNMINSIISSGQSFLGAINIYGNLNGDILMPEYIKNQLLASNAVPMTLDTASLENHTTLANVTNNQTIKNDINLAAASGSATVENNTSAGNATTGSANTKLTVLNMTGQQVVGNNALLIFVNVLGEWIGMIVNAPVGTTAAALGDGSTAPIGGYLPGSSLTAENNMSITNNLNLNAASGDAEVSNNTSAGNATSGDASASANVANLMGSNFSLASWFGILFINVFGTWHGSFGIDTANGNAPAPATSGTPKQPVNGVQVFRFVPTTDTSYRLVNALGGNGGGNEGAQQPEKERAVLSSVTSKPSGTAVKEAAATAARQGWNWFATLAIIIGFILLGTERFMTFRERRGTHAA